jgi:hypothetical protein
MRHTGGSGEARTVTPDDPFVVQVGIPNGSNTTM